MKKKLNSLERRVIEVLKQTSIRHFQEKYLLKPRVLSKNKQRRYLKT